MIMLTRLNGIEFVLNSDLIETVEEHPDTTIKLTTGTIYIVQETVDEVIELATQYKKDLFTGLLLRRNDDE